MEDGKEGRNNDVQKLETIIIVTKESTITHVKDKETPNTKEVGNIETDQQDEPKMAPGQEKESEARVCHKDEIACDETTDSKDGTNGFDSVTASTREKQHVVTTKKDNCDETNRKKTTDKEKVDEVETKHENTTIRNVFVDVDFRENNNDKQEKRTRFNSEELNTSNEDIVITNEELCAVELNQASSDDNKQTKAGIETFFPLTILSCIFCCPFIGLFALHQSIKVKNYNLRGDERNATRASLQARHLGILSLVFGSLFLLAITSIIILVSEIS